MRAFAKRAPVLFVVLGVASAIHAENSAPLVDGASAQDSPPSKVKEMSVEEMRAGSATIAEQLRADATFVLHLKEVARNKKDVLKLTCVNDRMLQMKAQRNIADSQILQLNTALASDGEERYQVYSDLMGSADAVRRLREEATGCAGEPDLFKVDSTLVVDRPDVPDDPIVDNPFTTPADYVDVEPPGYASPFY